MFKLVISDDEGKQTVVPLVRDEITVGRKEGNTIRLTERNVSRRHARLLKANGSFVVEDLHSYNGVKVNGQRIGAETKLDPGDQITIGDYQIALQMEAGDTLATGSPAVADADTALIAAPGPPARLVMITPPAPGAEFALTNDRVRIGRAEDLEVWVNHRSISREHAEIQKEPDGGLRLIDLGSANGVRVNNQDVQNALLSAGDVVELGQVRFRFVAAGEHYAFDADRTVQMDAVTVESGGGVGSKLPILVAIAILLLAVIGAVAVAFIGGDDPETTASPLETPSEDNVVATTGPNDSFQTTLDACTDALTANDIARALTQANAALALRPGDAAATSCLRRAEAIQAHEQIFNVGVRHLEAGELREAYFQFDNLPGDSPLRDRQEVRQAVRTYAGVQLNEGQEALTDDASEALRIADFVLNMHGLTPELRSHASELQRSARESGGSTAPAVIAAANPRVRPPGPRTNRPPRPDRPTAPAATPDPPPERPTPASNPGAGSEEEAVACSIRGDNSCVIRLLEGRARSARALGLLIEAYRARGQTEAALRHMRTFVQRFPGTPRARNYQQIISRH